MDISIFGLGYVGSVVAACLAKEKHFIVGVDVNRDKVKLFNDGKSPIVEPGLEDLIAEGVENGRIRAVSQADSAVRQSELSMICVGTPSRANGTLDLTFVERVCRDIGQALRHKDRYHLIVVRSTMLPGSVENCVIPALESASKGKVGKNFGVVYNPEFLRESTAVADFYQPAKTVIGEVDPRDGDVTEKLYAAIDAPVIRTSIKVAEMTKYAENSFHALKTVFANEIGAICRDLEIDSHAVMDILCADRQLNISPAYLRPGFAFGGSCLPKDIRALAAHARRSDLNLPVIEAILPSNQIQVERALQVIRETGKQRIGLLGVAFKAGTDDLRESPMIELIERLLGKGFDLQLYDRDVTLSRLTGSNRRYVEERVPHLARFFVDTAEEVVAHADLLVIANRNEEFGKIVQSLPRKKQILDLVRICDPATIKAKCLGIGW